jgi:ankyrin repeat protein
MRLPTLARALALTVLGICSSTASRAQSELADLIQSGRRFEAIRLIEAGTDVAAAQPDGSTPLHWAVYRKDAALVDRLLDRGADPSVSNRFGSSPLAEAVKTADAAIVGMLLDAGADPDMTNLDGQTPLMLAARTGSREVAERLVAGGADINAIEAWRGQTALMWATAGNFPELAQFLVTEGADVSVRAAVNDWGSQITSEPRAQYRPTGGLTALLYAARAGCIDCISAIVAAGEPVDRPTPEGVTPLMIAIDNLQFDAAAHLLDLGANPNYADWWGRTALYIAVDMNTDIPGIPNSGSPESTGSTTATPRGTTAMAIVQRLLDAGVEVNPQLNMHRVGRGGNSQRFTDDLLTTGATPLLRAAIMHDLAAMRVLLDHGALVDLPNVMGVTPLMAAASVGVRDVDFGSNRSPSFATDEAIEDKIIASMEILLAAGADINARVTDTTSRTARIARPSQMTDREGRTALFRVASQGWPLVAGFMLENDAEADVVDALGRSPLDEARGQVTSGSPVHEDVAAILEAAIAEREPGR